MKDEGIAIGIMVLVLGFVVLIVVAVLVLQVLFLLTLFRCMKKIQQENRTMEPALVWLNLVPMLNLGWIFYTVIKIKESLEKEFSARNLKGDGDFGYKIGLTYAILGCCSAIPYIGALPGIVAVVFWIMYWVKIADFSRRMDIPVAAADDVYDVKALD